MKCIMRRAGPVCMYVGQHIQIQPCDCFRLHLSASGYTLAVKICIRVYTQVSDNRVKRGLSFNSHFVCLRVCPSGYNAVSPDVLDGVRWNGYHSCQTMEVCFEMRCLYSNGGH